MILTTKSGWIESICGPMFSGKTKELQRRVRLARIAKQKVQVFKPTIDDRFKIEEVVDHDRGSMPCSPVSSSTELLSKVHDDTDVVAVDEVQFFSEQLARDLNSLANRGKRVVAAGLNGDWRAEPFPTVSLVLAHSESVDFFLAVCFNCGDPAAFSHLISGEGPRVQVGASDKYQALCRTCRFRGA